MVDGRIVMPNVAADQNVGPHNLYWQFAMGGEIGFDGSAAYFKSKWNSTGAGRVAQGIYEVQTRRFDAINGTYGTTAIHIFAGLAGLPGGVDLKPTFTGGTGGASKFEFAVLDGAGALVDLTVNLQFITYWIVSRRYRGGNTDQGHNYLVTLNGFLPFYYWMGVPGLGDFASGGG